MHIVEDEFSKCYKLGEVDYEIAVEEDQLNTVMGVCRRVKYTRQKLSISAASC